MCHLDLLVPVVGDVGQELIGLYLKIQRFWNLKLYLLFFLYFNYSL